MKLAELCDKLRERRETALEAVLTGEDPGFVNVVPEADESDFLVENTDTFFQRLGGQGQYSGVIRDQVENAFLSDFQRGHQLARETRVQRFQRTNRTRYMESMSHGVIEDRIRNTLLKHDEELLMNLMEGSGEAV